MEDQADTETDEDDIMQGEDIFETPEDAELRTPAFIFGRKTNGNNRVIKDSTGEEDDEIIIEEEFIAEDLR